MTSFLQSERRETMPCPTCDHTMEKLDRDDQGIFWCPRCGTVQCAEWVPSHEAPKLVRHALRLHAAASAVNCSNPDPEFKASIETMALNVLECVALPAHRKTVAVTLDAASGAFTPRGSTRKIPAECPKCGSPWRRITRGGIPVAFCDQCREDGGYWGEVTRPESEI
jgi:ribosomal protein L37AE/L43A